MTDFAVGETHTKELTQARFPCAQCGAMLHYAIGTKNLSCNYCGHSNRIKDSTEQIRELDLHRALRELQNSRKVSPQTRILNCPNCAAEFALDAHMHAGECPFCATTVVTGTGDAKLIKPKGLLPFAVTEGQARDSYKRWLSGLWFAPNELKKYARADTSLNGVYVPYWTYDSDTATAYSGQRGDVYYVRETVFVTVNGKRVRQTRQVPKIRWTPVNGRTSRHFDDVLVGATRTLPRKITDWLEPWDLPNLVPYTSEYLSGFSSEVYQVELDEGFNHAQVTMDRIIRSDVARAIGGDQQRIHRLDTRHSETTFKHVLLPIWSAAFQFRKRTYRFVVNGRTGKIRGERPYSAVKITLAVVALLSLLAGFAFYANKSGLISSDPYGRAFDNAFDQNRTRDYELSINDPIWPGGNRPTRELPRNRGIQDTGRADNSEQVFPPTPSF